MNSRAEKKYIYYNDSKIAGCSLVSAKTALYENRVIPFEIGTFSADFPKDIRAASFAGLIAEGIDQNLGIQYSMQEVLYEVRDSAGKIIFFNYQEMLPDYATTDQHLSDLFAGWKEEYKGRIIFSLSNSDGRKGLHLAFPDRDLNDPENALSDFVLFYQKNQEELTDGSLQRIVLNIGSRDNNSDVLDILLSMSFESGKLEISSGFGDGSLWIYGKNQEAFKTYILESAWWRPMLNESVRTAEEK